MRLILFVVLESLPWKQMWRSGSQTLVFAPSLELQRESGTCHICRRRCGSSHQFSHHESTYSMTCTFH